MKTVNGSDIIYLNFNFLIIFICSISRLDRTCTTINLQKYQQLTSEVSS